jgi:hypothetical protein
MNKKEQEESLKDLENFERENFAVEVRKDTFIEDFTVISVTHNRSQWSSIQLNNPKEIIATIEALHSYLKTLPVCQYCGSDNPHCQCWNDA